MSNRIPFTCPIPRRSSTPLRRLRQLPLLCFLACIPSLPAGAESRAAEAEWKPVPGAMMTRWGQALAPDKVWDEYPRPLLQRDEWTNLNGLWDYAVTRGKGGFPAEPQGRILVPFPLESALSGVGRLLEPHEFLYYRRNLPPAAPEKRTLLHFEGVDYETTAWVNGREVGSHRGAFTPFTFDITDALNLKPGEPGELVVRVVDQTGGYQLHGKQKLRPGGIWYTRASGIWQTVWLETVAHEHIADLVVEADPETGNVTLAPKLSDGSPDGRKFRATASIDGRQVAATSGSAPLQLQVPGARLWSPANPHLYDLQLELLDDAGAVIDQVGSYTAFRSFGKDRDAAGHLRLTLNGEPVFHWGPLDQGWWPDGLITPPSDEAMLSDIEFLKDCGFNMIRKHIKVEPRRYYYHCDRLGMLVWQDHVSQGHGKGSGPEGSNPQWTRLAPAPPEGKWPDEAHAQFLTEYRRMVHTLRGHPSIAVWVPFNEAWGQHRTREVGEMAVALDPTRAINIASGGNFIPVGDIADHHSYPHPNFPLADARFKDFVKVVGEFGGHAWPVEGHLWSKGKGNWGYGGIPATLDEWKARYHESIDQLIRLRGRGIAAGVYTQTSDVEIETNGLLTYDRVRKVDPAWLRQQSRKLVSAPDVVTRRVLMAGAGDGDGRWLFTNSTPAGDWHLPGFQDHDWKEGAAGFGSPGTPGARIGTLWKTSDIWMRRRFELPDPVTGEVVLRIFHDEDVTVFINGAEVLRRKGYVTGYHEFPLKPGLLAKGANLIAVHCRQSDGGQYIDVEIVVDQPQP